MCYGVNSNSALVRKIEGPYFDLYVIDLGKLVWIRTSEYLKATMSKDTKYEVFKINEKPLYYINRRYLVSGNNGFNLEINSEGQVSITPYSASLEKGTGINFSEFFIKI